MATAAAAAAAAAPALNPRQQQHQQQLNSSSPLAPTATDRRRDAFELRMSKKVAELTQVIHILFVHNHEKEVRLAALADAYEQEIDDVIADAKSRIAALELRLKHAGEFSRLTQSAVRSDVEQQLVDSDRQWAARVQDMERVRQELESRLIDEQQSRQNLNDELLKTRDELERLRSERAADSTRQVREAADHRRDIDKLKRRMADMEKQFSDREAKEALKRVTAETELADTRRRLAAVEGVKDSLTVRNRRLEDEIQSTKRQLLSSANDDRQRRQGSSLSIRSNNTRQEQQQQQQQQQQQTSAPPPPMGRDEVIQQLEMEIFQLRHEVSRLRMELGNREENFNRVFTAQRPILVAAASRLRADTAGPSMTSRLVGGAINGRLTQLSSSVDAGETDACGHQSRDSRDFDRSKYRMTSLATYDVTVNRLSLDSANSSTSSSSASPPLGELSLPPVHDNSGQQQQWSRRPQQHQQPPQNFRHHSVHLAKPIPMFAKAR